MVDRQFPASFDLADLAIPATTAETLPDFLMSGMSHNLLLPDSKGLPGFLAQRLFNEPNLLLQFVHPSSQLHVVTTKSEELLAHPFQGFEINFQRRCLSVLLGYLGIVELLFLFGQCFSARDSQV
jgi:hypothetical protein